MAMAAASSSTVSNASAPAWRQFSFFDAVPVKDAHDLNSSPDIFKSPLELSTLTSSSAGVLVADIHGSIHLLNDEFESISSWVAHVGGRVTHMVERQGVLVTLGDEDAVRSPLLKIWDLNNKDKKTGAPNLLRSAKVQPSNRPHPVTTVALSTTLSHLAIGLGDGTVLLYRHLGQSLTSSTSLTALPKPRTVHESPTEPITGLGFREVGAVQPVEGANGTSQQQQGMALFVVTTNHVLAYVISGKGAGGSNTTGSAVIVDEVGCGLGCASMDWRGRDVVVAREEAVYVCGVEGRGACYAYEGTKSSIHTHLNYLVIVSPPFVPTASAASATVRNFVARSTLPSETDITKLTVFDLENKLVAYSGTFTEGVKEVVSQWGKIFVLTNDGNLLCLQEKPTTEKLDMLYRKSLYVLALNLAKTQMLDDSGVADIHRQYGDHLYSKGDYDGAMAQFVKTIGHVQPSYVIRKFLDAQRIHNLVTYLQELHSLGRANADHTTLLLNTYTKLKDVSRLDNFIRTESKRHSAERDANEPGQRDLDELPFDLDTAIRVCRQAGYYEHASYLAGKYGRHEDYLRIQIEDAGQFGEALAYLKRLGGEAAESNLARYGRAMLENLPTETTELLIDLCAPPPPPQQPSRLTDTADESGGGVVVKQPQPGPSYLSYLALNRGGGSTIVSDAATTISPPSPSLRTVRAADASSSRRRDSMQDFSSRPTSPTAILNAGPPGISQSQSQPLALLPPAAAAAAAAAAAPIPPPSLPKRISPRIYFAHFVDHTGQFVTFLETVAWRRWGQSVDEQRIGSARSAAPRAPSTTRHQQHQHQQFSALGRGGHDDEDGDGNDAGGDSAYPGCDDDDEGDKQDQVAVWNTLLELYLTLSSSQQQTGLTAPTAAVEKTNAEREVLRAKALRVLEREDEIPYDRMHALILCSTRGYTPGLVVLWEKMGMHEDVLRFWMDRAKAGGDGDGDTAASSSKEVVRRLDLYGEEHPHLYLLVLRFLVETPEMLRRHAEDVRRIVEVIDRKGLVPPLGIVQILSRNGVASVGLVKDWLIGKIKESRREIQEDKELIDSYRLETAAKVKQVAELTDPDHPRVFHVTRCSACSGQLDLPSLHFMCNHSYHQRCLADHENECPNCAREHGVIREIRKNNERLADQHDVFLEEVKEGGFEAVAGAFGRGILNYNQKVLVPGGVV